MTREERCKWAIEKGYIYNPETGYIYNTLGKIVKRRNKGGYLYMTFCIDKKQFCLYAHHFAWFCVYKECVKEIDHINRINDDNRICNLRSVTRQENQFNRTAKGYSWNKHRNKWRARIFLNNKEIYLGLYITEEEARNAYLEAKEKYHII